MWGKICKRNRWKNFNYLPKGISKRMFKEISEEIPKRILGETPLKCLHKYSTKSLEEFKGLPTSSWKNLQRIIEQIQEKIVLGIANGILGWSFNCCPRTSLKIFFVKLRISYRNSPKKIMKTFLLKCLEKFRINSPTNPLRNSALIPWWHSRWHYSKIPGSSTGKNLVNKFPIKSMVEFL